MANLAADTQFGVGESLLKVRSLPLSFRIADAVRIWAHAMCALPGANANTSARGYLIRWEDEINVQWAGFAEASSWTGGLITSAQTGTAANVNSVLGATGSTPVPEITVETGPFILREVAVTGVSAQADVWRTLVYLSTDNYADLTSTATTYAPAIGKVVYWNTSTTCSVYFFGMLRSTAIS